MHDWHDLARAQNIGLTQILCGASGGVQRRGSVGGEIAAGFTFFSLGIIPSRASGYARYTYQIIDTKSRSNERIQTQLTGYIWWSSVFYPLFNSFQQSGQYGATRLEMNLKVVAAIEAMGHSSKLPVE